MYRIERRFGGGAAQAYPVYTTTEAREEGLDVKDWPRVDIGEWGQTDDGYVLRCHDIYEMERREGVALQFKFTSGRPIAVLDEDMQTVRKAPDFRFLDYLRTGGHQYSKPQTWQEREAKKTRTERACKAWAAFWILRDGKLRDRDWAKIGRVYRTDDAVKEPRATAKRLFNEPEIQRKAMNELAQQVLQAGESPQDVIEKYNQIFEDALEGEDAEDRQQALEVADRLRDMLRMDPDRQPDPDSASSDGLLMSVEEEEANVKEITDASTDALPEGP
jgi:uncharacterized protein (DUF2267 family)